ncbi:MAG: hypothetical protein ACYCQI_04980, partial [Gammaproteobacteria bacterium]
ALDKIRNSEATLYKSPNSKYVISYNKGEIYPMGVESPWWPKNRAGFVEGWKQATAFLALKDPDVQKHGLKISLKSPPVNSTEEKKDYLVSILEIAKHAHDDKQGLGLKTVLDPSIRKGIAEVLTDPKIKLTTEERQKLKELDELDKQLVKEAGERAEKKAVEDAKPVGPYEGAPRRMLLEEHAENLAKGKTLPDPPTTKEQLDQLDGRFKALANAHQEVRLYLEAIKPPNKPTDEIKGQMEKAMDAMRAEEAVLFAKYRETREKIKAMPDSAEKTALMHQADQTFAKVSSFLTQNILPQAAEFQQKVGSQDDLLKWHAKELQTPLPASPPAPRDEIERAMVISMNKIERAVDEIKRMETATPPPDKTLIDALKVEIKAQMGNLQPPLYDYLIKTPADDGTKAAQDANAKSNILRDKYNKDIPAKLADIGMGPAPGAAPRAPGK